MKMKKKRNGLMLRRNWSWNETKKTRGKTKRDDIFRANS